MRETMTVRTRTWRGAHWGTLLSTHPLSLLNMSTLLFMQHSHNDGKIFRCILSGKQFCCISSGNIFPNSRKRKDEQKTWGCASNVCLCSFLYLSLSLSFSLSYLEIGDKYLVVCKQGSGSKSCHLTRAGTGLSREPPTLNTLC